MTNTSRFCQPANPCLPDQSLKVFNYAYIAVMSEPDLLQLKAAQCYRSCRYIFLVGILMAQFTMTGFDACAHMSEETKGADKSAPTAMVMSIGAASIAGFAYLLALLFSIQVRKRLRDHAHACSVLAVALAAIRCCKSGHC